MKFLGSIWLAVPLIIVLAIVVIIGTVIESRTDSHEIAASWIYSHPLFNGLLALFFVNILVSALQRYPWKKRHIPFLMTHLGLLMVIAGTMIKNVYGIQGHMFIAEGSGSNTLYLSGTKSLVLQEEDPQNPLKLINHSYPLDRKSPSGFKGSSFLQLKSYTPHSTAQLTGFIQTAGVQLYNFPFISKGSLEPLLFGNWHVGVLSSDDLESTLNDLRKVKPSLTFIEGKEQDTLFAVSKEGATFIKTLTKIPTSYNAYNRGFGGYSLEVELPSWCPPVESPLRQKIVVDSQSEIPALVVEFEGGEKVALQYDKSGLGMKWPVMKGRYLASFSPQILEMDTRIRLKAARKVCYFNTNEVKAYEADVTIDGEPFTLKMNQVFENSQGWRFYLSNLILDPGERKSIQIVVNYDPVRYPVTYPGALLLSIGTALILFRRRKIK